jgi:Domain of unknown function (DUF4062)/AAA ATPase domain
MAETAGRLEDTLTHRWKVFISSTGLGLEGFRDVARDVIDGFTYAGAKCFEPVMMEDFGVRDWQAREFCAAKVRKCDVLVGITGIRYGSHPADDHPPYTSYTEVEYRTAVKYRISRLMFVLDEEVAKELEGTIKQTAGEAQRQKNLREEIGNQRLSGAHLTSAEEFRQRLEEALRSWVEEDSFKRLLVGRATEFELARDRLLNLRTGAGGTALVYGEPGTGKTAIVSALLADLLLRRSFTHLVGPLTVHLAEGADAIEQTRAAVLADMQSLANQPPDTPAELRTLRAALRDQPLLITLFLATDDADDSALAAALTELTSLFTWEPLPVVILAETSNHRVKDRLREQLLPPEAVITIRDFDSPDDALDLMRRSTGDEQLELPEPETGFLAEALGLRPVALRDVATSIGSAAQGSSRQAKLLVDELLELIGHEKTPEKRYGAFIRRQIGQLSEDAATLLGLISILHPKPTLFPDEMALALDLSLSRNDAMRLAAGDDEEDEDEDEDDVDDVDADSAEAADPVEDQKHRNRATALVAELVSRALLERSPRIRPAAAAPGEASSPEPLLTLHATKIPMIRECLPLTCPQRKEGHIRAEAFYHRLIGEALMGSFDSRFRMEDDTWWEDVEEWIYHLAHLPARQADLAYAALFLDAFWWWDLYIPFEFCGKLLAYGHRPLVRRTSPNMPEVVQLLGRFSDRYPKGHAAGQVQILAELAGGDARPGLIESLRELAQRGQRVTTTLRRLCGKLGLGELDALFTDADADAAKSHADDPAPGDDNQRHHLLGLICLFLAHGHRYRALAEQNGDALQTAEICYRRARAHFQAQKDAWDLAWTQFELGDVISQRGDDPEEVLDEAEDGANDEDDTELLAGIERARGDHYLRPGHPDLEEALIHYGRAVFYGVAWQVTSNVAAGADRYTQAFYQEIRLHAAKPLLDALLRPTAGQEEPDARLAEARRRHHVIISQLDGGWEPRTAELDRALRAVIGKALTGAAVAAVADAAFPPGPDDAMLLAPQTQYHQWVKDLVSHVRPQQWVKGLGRWENGPETDKEDDDL